jgi:hypothetical protein
MLQPPTLITDQVTAIAPAISADGLPVCLKYSTNTIPKNIDKNYAPPCDFYVCRIS